MVLTSRERKRGSTEPLLAILHITPLVYYNIMPWHCHPRLINVRETNELNSSSKSMPEAEERKHGKEEEKLEVISWQFLRFAMRKLFSPLSGSSMSVTI